MYRRHLEKLTRTRLEDVLLDEGVLDRAVVEDAQAETEMTGRSLAAVLLEREQLDDWGVAKLLAGHYGLPFVAVETYAIGREAEDLLPAEFCLEHCVLAFDVFGDAFCLAVSEMPSPAVIQKIVELTKKTPFLYAGLRGKIVSTLEKRRPSGASERPAGAAPVAPKAAPAKPKPAGAPRRSRATDLAPVSMRLGHSMHARVATRSAAAARASDHAKAGSAPPTAPSAAPGTAPAWKTIFEVAGDDD